MMRSPIRSVVLILSSWTCFALALGINGAFQNASALGVAATVWGLTALALLAMWQIPSIKEWAIQVDLRTLLLFHLIRLVAGIYFLVLAGSGSLPAAFAKPAAIGDIIVALFALWILSYFQSPRVERLLLIWNAVGLFDIVLVVFNALRVGSADWESMAPLRALPLSLLPTLIVPLIIASHILIFIRLEKSGDNL